MAANYSTWLNMFTVTWNTKFDDELLEYLTCATDPYIIQSYFNSTMTHDDKYRAKFRNNKKRVKIILFIAAKHAKIDAVLQLILQHFELLDFSTKK